jgi:hypothetical protein
MRMSFSSLVVGAAVGYVLGARAGRRRYEQLVNAGQVTVGVSRAAYRAGEAGLRTGANAIERIRVARAGAAPPEWIDERLDAADVADAAAAADQADQPFNGRVRVP